MSGFEDAVNKLCQAIKEKGSVTSIKLSGVHEEIQKSLNADNAMFLAKNLVALRPEALAAQGGEKMLKKIIHQILDSYDNLELYNVFSKIFFDSYAAWRDSGFEYTAFLNELNNIRDKYHEKSRKAVIHHKSLKKKTEFVKKLQTDLENMNEELVKQYRIVSLSDFFNLTFYHVIYGKYPENGLDISSGYWRENIEDKQAKANYDNCVQGDPKKGFYARITALFDNADMLYVFHSKVSIAALISNDPNQEDAAAPDEADREKTSFSAEVDTRSGSLEEVPTLVESAVSLVGNVYTQFSGQVAKMLSPEKQRNSFDVNSR